MIGNKSIFDYKIKNFCAVGDGAHASIERQMNGVMYLTSKNFKKSGIDLSKVDYISEADFEKYFEKNKSAIVKPSVGDVVFGIIGSIGTPYVMRQTDRFGLSSSVGIIRPNQDISPKYLYYFMTSSPFQLAVEAMKSGSAQGFLSLEMIRNLPLIKYDIKVQQKIAAILSSYDDLIENNQRRITLLEKMAEEIYREWFVRFRFPGYQSAEFEKGIPKGWNVKKIGDIYNTSSGGTPSRKNLNNYGGDINWLKTGELKNIFAFGSEEKITLLGLESSSAKIFPVNTVIIAMYCAMADITILAEESSTNQACCAFLPKHKYLSHVYTYYLIKFAQNHMIQFAHGAAQQNLSQDLIKGFKILVAKESIIREFTEKLTPIFDQIQSIAKCNSNLIKTRELLLPRLISGKLSVENLDSQFPPSMCEDGAA
ncbi:MAG: restriction endonuclease subunit S [Sulfuricurvum sp.]|uniref:restriction endonuclease subunit S n=1 Tax=Sulfuricurvum sp. TaxID=2025608 RepID=UPI00261356A5|nr:restriction endonuclease subunit S [Sulfuricurvum sp.]MDD2830500.1 restriction endonuclease subunit S [Sulfuricurvum sp.]